MGIINLSPLTCLTLRVEEILNEPIKRKSVYLNLIDEVKEIKSSINNDQKNANEDLFVCNELKKHLENFISRYFQHKDNTH